MILNEMIRFNEVDSVRELLSSQNSSIRDALLKWVHRLCFMSAELLFSAEIQAYMPHWIKTIDDINYCLENLDKAHIAQFIQLQFVQDILNACPLEKVHLTAPKISLFKPSLEIKETVSPTPGGNDFRR
jgi:hypothetical protein